MVPNVKHDLLRSKCNGLLFICYMTWRIETKEKSKIKLKTILFYFNLMISFSNREKYAFDDNYDYDYYDNYDSLMSSPDPIKDFTKNTNLLFQKNPVPNFPQQFGSGWPTKLNDAFKNSNVKNINYLGLHTNPNPQSQVSLEQGD